MTKTVSSKIGWLSVIQYDAIMQAINNAQAEIADDTFIDPYADNPDQYTNEQLAQALDEVRDIIISENIPF